MDQAPLQHGLKIFIVNPDFRAKEQEAMISSLFLGGYELYFAAAKNGAALDGLVAALSRTFDELIIYVNIDRSLSDVPDYPAFVKRLVALYATDLDLLTEEGPQKGRSLKLGVMHAVSRNLQNRLNENNLEYQYLFEIRVGAGLYALGPELARNVEALFNLLDSHEYLRGYRRRTVRAIYSNSANRVSFVLDGQDHSYKLEDISVSHFSVLVPASEAPAPHARVADAHIGLKLAIIKTNCILSLVKPVDQETCLCVFLFTRSKPGRNGASAEVQGLDEANLQKVNHCICLTHQQRMDELLKRIVPR